MFVDVGVEGTGARVKGIGYFGYMFGEEDFYFQHEKFLPMSTSIPTKVQKAHAVSSWFFRTERGKPRKFI